MILAFLAAEGWLEAFPLLLVGFVDVGLAANTDDRTLWRYCQTHRIILLTANRNMKDADSLEQTIREENTETCLPVVTIGNNGRVTNDGRRLITCHLSLITYPALNPRPVCVVQVISER